MNSFIKKFPVSAPQGIASLLALSFLQLSGVSAFLAADEEFLVVFCTFFFVYQTWEILTSSMQEFVAHRSQLIAVNLKQMPGLIIQLNTQLKKTFLETHYAKTLALKVSSNAKEQITQLQEKRELALQEKLALQIKQNLISLVSSRRKGNLQPSIARSFRGSLLEAFYERPLQNSKKLVFESLIQLKPDVSS
jgi:hypothetical protein